MAQERLYHGGYRVVGNLSMLQELGVTAVVNTAKKVCTATRPTRPATTYYYYRSAPPRSRPARVTTTPPAQSTMVRCLPTPQLGSVFVKYPVYVAKAKKVTEPFAADAATPIV